MNIHPDAEHGEGGGAVGRAGQGGGQAPHAGQGAPAASLGGGGVLLADQGAPRADLRHRQLHRVLVLPSRATTGEARRRRRGKAGQFGVQ